MTSTPLRARFALLVTASVAACGGGTTSSPDPNDALVGSYNIPMVPHGGGTTTTARLDIRRDGDHLYAWMFAGPPNDLHRFYEHRLVITPDFIDVSYNTSDLDINALHATRDPSGHLVQASGLRVIVSGQQTSRDDYTGRIEVDRIAPTASASTVMSWETAALSFSEPLLTEEIERASEPGLVRDEVPFPRQQYQEGLRVHLSDWRQRSPLPILLDGHDPAGNALAFDARTAFHDAGEARPQFDLGNDEPTVSDPAVRRSSEGPCMGEACITTRGATLGFHLQGGHAHVGLRFRAAGGEGVGRTLGVPLRLVAHPFGADPVESSPTEVTLAGAADAATAAEGLPGLSGWQEITIPVPVESADIGVTILFGESSATTSAPPPPPARLFLSRVFTAD